MRVPLPDHSLFQFLRAALHVHGHFISGALSHAEAPIYVIGNPSADLDSIISALVYSYFANNRVPSDHPRPHVPVINLAKVPAGSELGRLRPEFAKTLWLSTRSADKDDAGKSSSDLLKEHFLTVADFATHLRQNGSGDTGTQFHADSVLVDWNALPIRSSDQPGKGSLTGLSAVEFTVLGCIDHHANEDFLPPIAGTQPHIVEPAGSCTSLVIAMLQEMGLWQTQQSETSNSTNSNVYTKNAEQMAKLALAPILIDTANLTSKDKVTDFDTSAYDFLLSATHSSTTSWNPDGFYTEINETKQNSLELLTVDEILDRDYKEWSETPSGQIDVSAPLQIGICSMVKSIPWIVRKAGSAQAFLDSLQTFAAKRKLDIIVVMSAFSSPVKDGQFSRELLVCTLDNGHAVDALRVFVSDASSQLGLEEWSSLDGDDHAEDIQNTFQNAQDASLQRRIWVQTDVTKGRKQVAPLIRRAVTSLS